MKQKSILRLLSIVLLLTLLLGGCAVAEKLPAETVSMEPDGFVTLPTQPALTDPETGLTSPAEPAPDTPAADPGSDRPAPDPTEAPAHEASHTPTQAPAVQPETVTPIPDSGGFKVYFIDVGQADAALVICDGKAMLIDGGNAADSNLIYSFLQKKGVSHLDYVIATHGHEDHVGGLSGALNAATAGTVYCPVTSYSSNAFDNFVRNVQKQGKSITVPSVGTSFSLGSASCSVLAVNTSHDDPNNTSIVLRVVYGSTSFLFTGDAESLVEQAMVNRGADLRATVLKVGHHGSSSSSSYQFLWNVMPQYAVISCGKGNDYGHPHEEVLSRLHDADTRLFRTDLQGDILCTSNGSSVEFSVSRNWDADVFNGLGSSHTAQPTQGQPQNPDPESPPAEGGTSYILNTNSMKFHTTDCQWGQKTSQKNRKDYTGSREEVIAMGYTPCGSCDP